ncbi:xanthine transmembrane transporter [Aureococcus anophagefferens]|nr:xanthine transmembrane transporter [Aureococcus anophagefferens]
MDADAGVALTETDKEKSIDEAKPAEPLPDMGFSPDMDETGAGCNVCMPPGGIVGADKYDYKYLCLPSMPWSKGGVAPPKFLSKDERLPLVVALTMGLQHALAMVAGIATSGGLLIAGDACFPWQKDSAMCDAREYMISAAWITSGILTIIQVFRAKILGTPFYLGTGLISVMGTSFTFLPIAREMVIREIRDASAAGKCDGGDCRGFGKEGYGKFLGTCMVASLFEIAISMMPSKVRKRLFPPVVTGAAVMLIGVSLISSGIKYVGGGVFCGENDFSRAAAFGDPQYCNENGNVILPFGSAEYVGLAASVIAFTVFAQFAGSPFLKSTCIFWGLMFGCFVAGVSRYEAVEGDMTFDFHTSNGRVQAVMVAAVPGRKYKYFNDYKIRNAPWFTFLWDITFPLGFSQGVLPAHQQRRDPAHAVRASRAAGFACAFWLILFGVIGKIGAAFSSIPICVVGGVVLQCFAMVFVSGMNIATRHATRRNNYILMVALALGIGVGMEPQLFEGGGPAAFYGGNLRHNIGFWPRHKTCDVFPSVTTTNTVTAASCDLDGYVWTSGDEAFETTCADLGGVYAAAVTEDVTETVKTCTNNNGFSAASCGGFCCLEYDDTKDANRTTTIILLKTTYGIGFLAALFLHIILPEDAVDPDDPYSENPASDLKYPTAGQHSLALAGHPEPAEA